jgi:glycosyltransferase involved in cell wall biosynthesis
MSYKRDGKLGGASGGSVLLVLRECPIPDDSGPRTHVLGIIRALSAIIRCGIVSFENRSNDQKNWDEFKKRFPNCTIWNMPGHSTRNRKSWKRFVELLRLRPPSELGHLGAKEGRFIDELAEREGFQTVVYTHWTVAKAVGQDSRLTRILVPHDAYSIAYVRNRRCATNPFEWLWSFALERLFRRLERCEYSRFTYVCPPSRLECLWLRKNGCMARLRAWPISLRNVAEIVNPAGSGEERRPLKVVCNGNFGYPFVATQLIDLLRALQPRTKEMTPAVELIVWGGGPPAKCLCEYLKEAGPGIVYVGRVDDYYAMLSAVDIFVYPQTTGSGIQTKVQNAGMLEKAIVGSPAMLKPLAFRHGKEAMLCRRPTEYVAAIELLLASAEQRRVLGRNARKALLEHFGPAAVQRKYAELLPATGGWQPPQAGVPGRLPPIEIEVRDANQ